MKNKWILAVALLMAGLAFWLNWSYLKKQREDLLKGHQVVKVIAAKRDLPALTVLTLDDLILNDVFQSAVGRNVFKEEDLDSLLGKKLLYPVRKNDPILWTQVDMPRRRGTGLSANIERGKRALSLAISGAPGVSGMVQPNDHVDIMGTFTFPSPANPTQVESVTLMLLQNVTVLATGTQIAGQADSGRRSSGGYSTVTFSVTPMEAEILVFAQQTRGQLYLSLRNPTDRDAEAEIPSINFDYIESILQQLNEERQREIRSNPL
jgi:pilus assembly protein CpaB